VVRKLKLIISCWACKTFLPGKNFKKLYSMAKQMGIIKLQGTIGDINFYKSQDGYMAREKGGVVGRDHGESIILYAFKIPHLEGASFDVSFTLVADDQIYGPVGGTGICQLFDSGCDGYS
jgi:hypothetical protein